MPGSFRGGGRRRRSLAPGQGRRLLPLRIERAIDVFDKKTGKVVTDATVTMSFVALDAKDKTAGAAAVVPVVIMQAIGKGPASTHYGNNVTMPAGRYRVTVTVNGSNAVFAVAASDAPPGTMAPMKM